MAKKLSSNAMKKLETLAEARRKWDRVRSLVEQAHFERHLAESVGGAR